MNILTFSTLYPNNRQLNHGIFVEHRLRRLVQSGQVDSLVVAPVPWFPSRHAMFGRYGVLASVPRAESRHGIDVLHPRYPAIPKVGMNMAPKLLAYGVTSVLRRIIAEGYDFDLIDAHYFYPDGVAAAMLGRVLGKPVVVTCRGDDVLTYPQYRIPRRLMLNAAKQVAAIVTVSAGLKDSLLSLGVPEQRVTVLRNGVDLELFQPLQRDAIRQKLGITGPTLLSVGHLIERKGHHFAVSALQDLSGYKLVIVGEAGPEPGVMDVKLKRQVQQLGLSERVRFVGNIAQDSLKEYYAAADALVLASAREGMPNVMLESLACGTPVVANPVGGIPEIITRPEAGVLMHERSADGVVAAVKQLFDRNPSRKDTRRYAETLGWEETTQGQLALFQKILNRPLSTAQAS